MDTRIERSEDSEILNLSGDLTIDHAHDIKKAVEQSLRKNEKVTINLKDITSADLTFLQILCSVHKAAAKGCKVLIMTGCQEKRFEQAVRESGFLRRGGCALAVMKCLWEKS